MYPLDSRFHGVLLSFFAILHLPTPVPKAKPISSICVECGTIMKSAKLSCCGRGGAWFGNCGSGTNSNLGHTWQEGIQVCKGRQFQAAVVQQRLNASQANSTSSSVDASAATESKAHILASTGGNTSQPTAVTTLVTVPTRGSIIAAASMSLAYDAGSVPYKTIIATIVDISVSLLTAKPIISKVDGATDQPANVKSVGTMQSTSTTIPTRISSHTLASTITAEGYGKWLDVATHISTVFIIIFWL